MIGRRLAERLKQHSWMAFGIELAVVIVGILLALQVDAWRQRREQRELERVYLQRLIEDLRSERDQLEAAAGYARRRIAAARLLDSLLIDPALARLTPARVPWAIETATWRSFPQINAFVYRELQGTGRLVVLRSVHLRRELAEHYTKLQHDARVGEDLSAQQRFDAAVAGVLSIDELETVERAAGGEGSVAVTSERAGALVRAFAQRPAAVAELPGLVQHHTFNLRVIGQARARSDAMIEQITALLDPRPGS